MTAFVFTCIMTVTISLMGILIYWGYETDRDIEEIEKRKRGKK